MLKIIDKEYLISSLKDFNEKVLSKVYAKIPGNKSVLDKLNESDGSLIFAGNRIGLKGDSGQDGTDGIDGKSAYEIAVNNGFVGSETEWLESLRGEKGNKGDKGNPGSNGQDGSDGEPGESAYQIAVRNGFEGDENAWLESLKGENGVAGSENVLLFNITLSYVNSGSQSAGTMTTHDLGSIKSLIPDGYKILTGSTQAPTANNFQTFLAISRATGWVVISRVVCLPTYKVSTESTCVWGTVPAGTNVQVELQFMLTKE